MVVVETSSDIHEFEVNFQKLLHVSTLFHRVLKSLNYIVRKLGTQIQEMHFTKDIRKCYFEYRVVKATVH